MFANTFLILYYFFNSSFRECKFQHITKLTFFNSSFWDANTFLSLPILFKQLLLGMPIHLQPFLQHFFKQLLVQMKSDGKHRNVIEFAEGAIKKVLTGLEMCGIPIRSSSKSVDKLGNVLAFP
jgi:hypothetical protein